MKKIKVYDLDLKATVTCGQIFRYYEEIDDSYTIILNDRVVNLKLVDDELFIKSNNMDNIENIVIDYLDLSRDYSEMNKKIAQYNKASIGLIKDSIGLKMIHQSPFETIMSYIISANNSVPSIRNSLNMISLKYGKKVIFNDNEYYLFPSYEDLKNVTIEDYRNCKVGFRDKYLYNFVKSLNNKEIDLEEINNLSTEKSFELLMQYPGIGPKVASCILLFAYQKFDVFPIDTWVKKYMKDNYNIEGEKNIRKFIVDMYHEYSGIVIQYMFNSKRNVKG